MKLLHIADLHIGKRVNGLPMLAEQLNIIEQLHELALEERIDGVLIAGDVFDRSVPSREALEACEALFSSFCNEGVPVFVVPGNHDSPQQLAFCSTLLGPAGLHVAKAYAGSVDHFDLEAGGQNVRIHLLPFVRPTDVRMAHPGDADAVKSYDDAVRFALSQAELADAFPNILVAHQFVTASGQAPETCDSETFNIGGTDNIDATAFDAFDYVALGHLHGPQKVGRETIRYAGTPLKYSFSEVHHNKSATIVDVHDGEVTISTHALEPLHDMREVTGSYADLQAGIDPLDHGDYLRVILTDRSLPDAMAKVRVIYPNVLRLDWEHVEGPASASPINAERVEAASPLELFSEFYEQQTSEALTEQEVGAFMKAFGGEST